MMAYFAGLAVFALLALRALYLFRSATAISPPAESSPGFELAAVPEYLLMAPGRWDVDWVGATDQQVPAPNLHLVQLESAVTLCGLPTTDLVAFREVDLKPKCVDCLRH